MCLCRRVVSEDPCQIARSMFASIESALLKQQTKLCRRKSPDLLHHPVKSESLAIRFRSHVTTTTIEKYTAFSGKHDE